MLTDEQMYERMAKGWRNGAPETICGPGSREIYTRNIRGWLPRVVRDLDIRTICDAGAGDLYWLSMVEWQSRVDLRYFDLIPRHPDVTEIDIAKEPLPECDLILCRLVLGHLDEPRRLAALDLFKRSGRYLAATQFDADKAPPGAKETVRVDLRPYLGEPMDVIPDGNHPMCRMALWSLS